MKTLEQEVNGVVDKLKAGKKVHYKHFINVFYKCLAELKEDHIYIFDKFNKLLICKYDKETDTTQLIVI